MLVVLFPNFSKFPNFTKLSLLMRPLTPWGYCPQADRLLSVALIPSSAYRTP